MRHRACGIAPTSPVHRGKISGDMDAHRVPSATRVALCSVALFVLAVLEGVGGPPSEFKTHVAPVWTFLGDYLLEVYTAAVGLALVGLVASVLSPRIGRLVSTCAAATTTTGNIVSAVIGARGDGRVELVMSLVLLPFVAVMWLPSKRSSARRLLASVTFLATLAAFLPASLRVSDRFTRRPVAPLEQSAWEMDSGVAYMTQRRTGSRRSTAKWRGRHSPSCSGVSPWS